MANNKVKEILLRKILDSLDKGEIPWKCGFKSNLHMPCNFKTQKPYHGINVLILWADSQIKGLGCPYWLTFNQISAMGGRVNKGEKATQIAFWKTIPVDVDMDTGEDIEIPLLRYYNVFNLQQTTGITWAKPDAHPGEDIGVIDKADSVIAAWRDRGNFPTLVEDCQGSTCSYSPSTDTVNMLPKKNFDNSNYYYAAFFHELAHSTGHVTRLKRDMKPAFMSQDCYSKEELIAEMSAAMLCVECGIDNSMIDNTVAYCQSWGRTFRDTPDIIFRAASKATKAYEYIMGVEHDKPKERDADTTD